MRSLDFAPLYRATVGFDRIADLMDRDHHRAALRISGENQGRVVIWGRIQALGDTLIIHTAVSLPSAVEEPELVLQISVGGKRVQDVAAEIAWTRFDFAPVAIRRTQFFDRLAVAGGSGVQLRAGEVGVILGPNGAGKSTLLRCCMHLIRPDTGEVRLFGTPLGGLDAQALRRLRAQVGFVFQKHNLVPRLSALSNVLHGALPRAPLARAWLQSLAPAALREEAMHCLERVGLTHIALRRAD